MYGLCESLHQTPFNPSSETQGQLVGAGKRLNGRGKKLGEEKSRKKVGAPGIIFLCPITGKDFKWFRNWSVKRRIPGAPTFFLDFSSPNFFPRPFSLFPAPTNCPWVSEDAFNLHQGLNRSNQLVISTDFWCPAWSTSRLKTLQESECSAPTVLPTNTQITTLFQV